MGQEANEHDRRVSRHVYGSIVPEVKRCVRFGEHNRLVASFTDVMWNGWEEAKSFINDSSH